MEEDRKLDRTGAYDWGDLVDEDQERPAEEYENPAGVSRGECDTEAGSEDSACHFEVTAQVDDLFMEETKPGFGIPGFEGEETGGG